MVRPSSCSVKGGHPELPKIPTYLPQTIGGEKNCFSRNNVSFLVTLAVCRSQLLVLAVESVPMDTIIAFSNLKIGGLPTLGADIGQKVQKAHFWHQQMSKSFKLCHWWGLKMEVVAFRVQLV